MKRQGVEIFVQAMCFEVFITVDLVLGTYVGWRQGDDNGENREGGDSDRHSDLFDLVCVLAEVAGFDTTAASLCTSGITFGSAEMG